MPDGEFPPKYDRVFPSMTEDFNLLKNKPILKGFDGKARVQDGKFVGFEARVGDHIIKCGLPGNNSWTCKFDRPVRFITISIPHSYGDGPFRMLDFYDGNDVNMATLAIYTDYWPEWYPATTFSVPEGFELIGFAVATNPDKSIRLISFTCWMPH